MADTQQYKCSTCKCYRLGSAFKVNRKGSRLKTCLGCNERKKRKPQPQSIVQPPHIPFSVDVDDSEVVHITTVLDGTDAERTEQMYAAYRYADQCYNTKGHVADTTFHWIGEVI